MVEKSRTRFSSIVKKRPSQSQSEAGSEQINPTGVHGILREDIVNPELERPGSRIREIIPVLTCYFIGAVILFGLNDIGDRGTQVGEVGARAWPLGLGWGIVLFGSIILITAAVKLKSPMEYPEPLTKSGFVKFIITMVVLFAYVYTFRVVPFWASTLVTIVILLLTYEMRRLTSLVLFSGLMTLILQLLFINFLRVPL